MDNLQSIVEQIRGSESQDGPTAVFLAGRIGKISMGMAIASIVIGLLLCFLGLKLIKVISALVGVCIGAAAGTVISSIADITGFTRVIIIFACAVVLAALIFFLHRVGIFLMTFIFTVSTVFIFTGADEKIYVMAALGAAVVLGIAAMIFAEQGAIIITSVIGGASAGTGIASISGLTDNPFVSLGIAGVLAVIGMAVQFVLYAKKRKKAEKTPAKKIKKKDSMESEVEKARMLLDDEEDTDE
ncbi:MAG: hypothetical protein HFH03_01800 [Dorea sp.]|jgi:MFS family permease|nr:hypothetical protein [Dorea sp.]